MMNDASSRRGFIRTVTIGGAGLVLASKLPVAGAAGKKKSVLVFTKSSGFEHQVV
ncbi:MAG: twin-arginine translocation signal domain-containing protein, partial [Acidobacteria bacterium]|nr:twin-arginine translocation signal domain-containing protein [Acidobacteriota bacterium]